jgi:Ni2+-binding GTPase involved in maturation of urease and hydrogenase
MTNLLHEPSVQTPFTLVLGGSTGSGKTEFVTKLLIYYQTKIKPVPVKITYYFSEYQAAYDELKAIVPFIEF